jgi:hypothetical protein
MPIPLVVAKSLPPFLKSIILVKRDRQPRVHGDRVEDTKGLAIQANKSQGYGRMRGPMSLRQRRYGRDGWDRGLAISVLAAPTRDGRIS